MVGSCLPEFVFTLHQSNNFDFSLTTVVPSVSADFAVSECRCSHLVSENERFGNSDCCLYPRGLRVCCISFCGRLRTTFSFLTVTPNTSPDQHIYISGIPSDDVSYRDWEVKSQRWSRNGKVTRSPPEPHSYLHRVEIIFLFCYTDGKLIQKKQICLFGWKSRAGCSSPLWGITMCSLHWHLCTRSLGVQGWWDTWMWARRSQSNCRSQHRYWRHPVLDIWDLRKTVVPIPRGKTEQTFPELYLMKTENRNLLKQLIWSMSSQLQCTKQIRWCWQLYTNPFLL